jgi:endonuclease V-like protein UPF0215 family
VRARQIKRERRIGLKNVERAEKVEFRDKQKRWESARKEEIEQREARRRHLELRCLQVQLERAEEIVR